MFNIIHNDKLVFRFWNGGDNMTILDVLGQTDSGIEARELKSDGKTETRRVILPYDLSLTSLIKKEVSL